MYDSTVGRFLSEDAFGFAAGDTNVFRYVGNSATMFVDPNGLWREPVGIFFDERTDFPNTDPVNHRIFRHLYDNYYYGVQDTEEILDLLGMDPDYVTMTIEMANVNGEDYPYLLIRSEPDCEGRITTWYGMFEGGYEDKPLIGYTFYPTYGDMNYNLTAMDKLRALQLIAPYYGLGVGTVEFKGGEKIGYLFRSRGALRPASSNHLGALGEMLAGLGGNKPRIQINGRTRIPDCITEFALIEVKNAKKLSFTLQLRDFVDIAKQRKLVFELHVRRGTQLSKPLQDAIDRGDIILKYILGN